MSPPLLLPKGEWEPEREGLVTRGGSRGGERGAHTRGQEDARRTTQWVTSVVTVNHSPNVDVRAAEKATATAPERATRKPGAMCATTATQTQTGCHRVPRTPHKSAREPAGWTRGGREGARQKPWIAEGRTTPATLKWRQMAKRATKDVTSPPAARERD